MEHCAASCFVNFSNDFSLQNYSFAEFQFQISVSSNDKFVTDICWSNFGHVRLVPAGKGHAAEHEPRCNVEHTKHTNARLHMISRQLSQHEMAWVSVNNNMDMCWMITYDILPAGWLTDWQKCSVCYLVFWSQ